LGETGSQATRRRSETIYCADCAGERWELSQSADPATSLQFFLHVRQHEPDTTVGSQMNGLGVFMSAQIAQGNFLNACMTSKGYLPVSAKTVTNASSFPRAK